MKIDRTMLLSVLFALCCAGLTACAGEEPPAASADSEATSGAEESMTEEAPAADVEAAPEETAAEEAPAEEATEATAEEGAAEE